MFTQRHTIGTFGGPYMATIVGIMSGWNGNIVLGMYLRRKDLQGSVCLTAWQVFKGH